MRVCTWMMYVRVHVCQGRHVESILSVHLYMVPEHGSAGLKIKCLYQQLSSTLWLPDLFFQYWDLNQEPRA